MQKLSQSPSSYQPKQWATIHTHIKTHSSYKSIYSQTNTYLNKLNKLLTQNTTNNPLVLMPKYQHQSLLSHLKLTYTKITNQIDMLDLSELSMCMEYILEKLLDSLGLYYSTMVTLLNKLNQEINTNRESFISLNQCLQCKTNIMKSNINNTMKSMTIAQQTQNFTIADKKKRNQELSFIQHDHLYNYENVELTLMIDEILSKKESILGTKTNKNSSNIYEEIVEYLESIPQNTVNLSKENNMHMSSVVGKIQDISIGNFSEEFDKNFGEMLKNPIKNLIRRILQYAKTLYYKPKQYQTANTQTLLIKDEENIKMLLKNIEILKKQLQLAKKSKREAEQDMVRLMDSEQINQLKISEISQQNIYLKQKLQRNSIQLNELRLKIGQLEQLKKQKQQKILKQHISERTLFIKSIKQLQIKIEATSIQLMRLRKQTQGTMVTQSTMTEHFQHATNQSQTDQKGLQYENWSINMSMNGNLNRNSMGNQSKKNYVSKFANINRKSVNNNGNLNNNSSQVNQSDTINQNNIQGNNSTLKNNNSFVIESESKKAQPPTNPNTNANTHPTTPLYNNKKTKPKQQIPRQSKEQYQVNVIESKKKRRRNSNIKRQSIAQKIEILREQNKKEIHPLLEVHQQANENNLQTNNFLSNQQELSFIKSQQSLRVDGIHSAFKNYGLFSRDGDLRHISPSGNLIRSRRKLESSRMFQTKQNCSPYIGGGCTGSSFTCGQDAWLEMLEINNIKRSSQLKNQTHREEQNIEKLQFVSKLMKKYSQLKECGLLSKINEIFSEGDMEELSDLKNNTNLKDKINDFQPSQNKRTSAKEKKISINKKYRSKNITPVNKSRKDKQNIDSVGLSRRQLEIFGKNQLILLFGSLDYAKKYELHIEIWGSLENSIMLDYNFMSLCDNIEIFLTSLQKTKPHFYLQCSEFIHRPLFYLQSKHESQQDFSKTQKSNKFNHLRNLSSTLKPNFLQGEKQTNSTPHELRNIFHKILRFHKIIHKKCSHVEQFLAIIGYEHHPNTGTQSK